jgi:hypothetical protein
MSRTSSVSTVAVVFVVALLAKLTAPMMHDRLAASAAANMAQAGQAAPAIVLAQFNNCPNGRCR